MDGAKAIFSSLISSSYATVGSIANTVTGSIYNVFSHKKGVDKAIRTTGAGYNNHSVPSHGKVVNKVIYTTKSENISHSVPLHEEIVNMDINNDMGDYYCKCNRCVEARQSN